MLKIAIIKEHKQPADKRAALTPDNCKLLLKSYPNQIEIWVERSDDRIFSDEEYKKVGCKVSHDISNCDILFGVKEVTQDKLIANKTYFFFSHTIKEQPYNQELFQAMIAKKNTMIDYETLVQNDRRVLGFGFHAGVVGAYNGLLTYGKKHKLFNLPPVFKQENYTDLVKELSKINFPPIQIAITGGGRVAEGVLKLLNDAGIPQVAKEEYLSRNNKLQFVHLKSKDLFHQKNAEPYNREHFHQNHHDYLINFKPYFLITDLFINGIFWTKDMPRFFTKEEAASQDFNISVIADISCDVNGSIPITYKATTIKDPVIGWDKETLQPDHPFSINSIDIMAVGNLPCELPKDASELFGHDLVTKVFPELMKDHSVLLQNATILEKGILTTKFQYLDTYAHGEITTK